MLLNIPQMRVYVPGVEWVNTGMARENDETPPHEGRLDTFVYDSASNIVSPSSQSCHPSSATKLHVPQAVTEPTICIL